MTAILARSPLQPLHMATNRPATRRRSVKTAFDDDDAPVAKRARMEGTGAAKKANGPAKKSGKAAYDEDEDGFQFTRRTSRRTTKAHAPAESAPQEPPHAAPVRRKKQSLATPEIEQTAPQRRRRSARLSGDKENLEARHGPARVAQPSPKRVKKGASADEENKKQVALAPTALQERNGVPAVVATPKAGDLRVSKKRDGATRIMLPFADTPVINRNKEMRKASKEGHRRSSTGLRGRRASSLIDGGMSNALPHPEIEVCDYYKYIEQSLPEPRRMKQLLTWCGSHALPAKPSGDVKDANAIMAARAIEQELIDDFASKPELSDWFSREDIAPPLVVKQPNPQNERNKATLLELEAEIKRLEEEKAAWEALATSPPPSSASQQQPPPTTATLSEVNLAAIDPSLLPPSQTLILTSLNPQTRPESSTSTPALPGTFAFTTNSALNTHLTRLAATLESHVDLFADGVHKIEQYRCTADRVADRVLGTAARRLEERASEGRERVGSQGVGVGDVLRGLAGVLAE